MCPGSRVPVPARALGEALGVHGCGFQQAWGPFEVRRCNPSDPRLPQGTPRSAGTSFSLRNTTWPRSLWVTQDRGHAGWLWLGCAAGAPGKRWSCRRPGPLPSRCPSVTPRSPARRLPSTPAPLTPAMCPISPWPLCPPRALLSLPPLAVPPESPPPHPGCLPCFFPTFPIPTHLQGEPTCVMGQKGQPGPLWGCVSSPVKFGPSVLIPGVADAPSFMQTST